MSAFYVSPQNLELILKDVLSVIKPSEEDYITRVNIINEFKAVVGSVESLRGATVEPFGSFVSNLYSKWGDLDISVELSGSLDSSPAKRKKQTFLKDIQKALRRRGGIYNLQFIPSARVPLLAFESYHRNISCDISISNPLGQIKSKFLLWINEIDKRFHDMVLLVKEWAKAQNINDPKAGTLNSYSLCLLVIFHFQTCVPAILPPLKELYAGNIADDLTGERVTAERNIQDTCAANIANFRSQMFRTVVNKSSLSELFVSFFEKFSRINSMASDYAICPYTGQWEYIRSNSRWMAKTYPLIIEDPFEQPDNAARAVGMKKLLTISEAFEGTHHRFISANQDWSYIIASLVRPQIRSQLNGRISQGNPSSGGGRGPIPSSHGGRGCGPIPSSRGGRGCRPVPSSRGGPSVVPRPPWNTLMPSPVQNQFQSMALESRPSSSVSYRRPGPVIHNQGQQMWRPKSSDR